MSDVLPITFELDKSAAMKLYREKLEQAFKDFDVESVFWDTNELVKRTCMSFDTIQKTFFYHSQFPKFKIGGKWYYPARKTREFLEEWILDQN